MNKTKYGVQLLLLGKQQITCVQAAGQEWQHPPVHRSKRTTNSNESNRHQQQYLVQPANTQQTLNIQPSTKIWKMEIDGSLATPDLFCQPNYGLHSTVQKGALHCPAYMA